MKLIEDLGRLYPREGSKYKYRYGLYECPKCFKNFKSMTSNIDRGNTTQCKRCSGIKHDLINHKLYAVWANEKSRCSNHKHEQYKDYGGRGIRLSDEFKDFITWFEYVKNLPNANADGYSIDRIDNNGNYERGNIRWATQNTQSRNTRVLRLDNTSGYRGVSKDGRKYRARITVDSQEIYLKSFDYDYTAAYVYDSYVIMNKLEHTRNFQ